MMGGEEIWRFDSEISWVGGCRNDGKELIWRPGNYSMAKRAMRWCEENTKGGTVVQLLQTGDDE